MNRTGKRRLLKLAKFLDNLPEDNFDMTFWVYKWGTNYSKQMLPKVTTNLHVPEDCGSVACALGWACRIPEFMENGLYMEGTIPCIIKRNGRGYRNEGLFGTRAGAYFFDISSEEAESLFLSNRYQSFSGDIKPQEVAEKIRKLVNKEKLCH
jgi:hypothetical protein